MTENIAVVGCEWGGREGQTTKGLFGDNGYLCYPVMVSQVHSYDRAHQIVYREYACFILYQLYLTKAESMGFVGMRENVLSYRGNCLRK